MQRFLDSPLSADALTTSSFEQFLGLLSTVTGLTRTPDPKPVEAFADGSERPRLGGYEAAGGS